MFWWDHLGNIWFSEPNFMKSEKSVFNVESYIFFMHSELATYLVPRLPLGLMIFQNYPLFFSPLPIIRLSLPSQWNRPTLCWRHHRPPLIPLSSRQSPSLSLSLILFLSFPFEITKREKEGRENEIGGGCQLERVVSDGRWWSRQSAARFCRQ